MNYFIEYKYLTDLILDEVVEIKHSAKFIDRILISTQPYDGYNSLDNSICHLRNVLIIKFEISDYFDSCQEYEIKDFFENEPSKEGIIEKENTKEDILIFLKVDAAQLKANEIAIYLIQTIFFHSGKTLLQFNLQNIETNLPQKTICTRIKIWTEFPFGLIERKLEIKEKIEIKNTLKSINWDNPYYSMLYSIMSNKEMDNISKYVILYSLLAEICANQTELNDPKGKDKGQQGKIERFLLMLGYDQPRKNYKNKSETIITNIRNKIGHTSKEKIDLESLQKETSENLDFLFFVLKQAVTRYKL